MSGHQLAKESGELPDGWTRLTMGEVGDWFGGGTPSKANQRFWTGGHIPWVSPKDMKSDLITDAQDHITEDAVAQSATNLVEAGSVLIVVRSGILQHTLPVAVTQRQVALNQDLKAVKPHASVRSDYLALALKAFEREILHSCTKTGTTVQSLEMPVFLRFRIPVASLPEQRRIVREIEKQFTRLDVGVTALRRVQANLKRYRAAVLKAACEGRLVPTDADLAKTGNRKATCETAKDLLARILTERRENWQGRGRYQEPAAPGVAGLPPLPVGWIYVSVETVGFVQLGRQRAPKHHAGTNMRPYLRVANVYEDRIDIGDVKEMNFTPEEFEVFRLEPNDILLNEGQSLELVGRPALYRGELPGACFTNTLVRFRPCPSLDVRFALSVFRAFMHSGRFQKIANWTTNIAHLGADRFAKLAFPLPPLAEQKRIVAEVERRLSVVEELEAVVSANLQRATRLRQAILHKAFTGKL